MNDNLIERLDMVSRNLVNQNIEKLAALFPNCVTENSAGKAIDFELLKNELAFAVADNNKERYRLEWPGKKEAIVTANLPTTQTLRPLPKESVNFSTTQNIYIEGDNLEVLKLLQESYLGMIKMIYIDPPYNTGKDFIYQDNFAVSGEEYQMESGQKDEDKNRLFVNPETSGRYHSDWLTMIYPRLKLARNLLTDDGVIFISIDDNEIHNLRKLCDEVFGEANFLATIAWQKRTSPDARKKISEGHEYILLYAKIYEKRNDALNHLTITEEQRKQYKNPDNDPRGPWTSSDFTAQIGHATPQQFYVITGPTGKEYVPPQGTCWKNIESVYKEKLAEGRFWFGKDGNSFPRRKTYLNESEGRTAWTWWSNKEVGHTQEASKELKELFQAGALFDNPKPVRLIKRLIDFATAPDSIILDFYSGSATTAHAVMELNLEQQTDRKYILVQLTEKTEIGSEAYKEGYQTIPDLGRERIRRAAKHLLDAQSLLLDEKKASLESIRSSELVMDDDPKVENIREEIVTIEKAIKGLDVGFRTYRLDSSNMQDVYYSPNAYNQESLDMFANNIKADRTADDLVAQVMLDWGLSLSLPIERKEFGGKEVFTVAGNSLFACFANGIDEEFAKAVALDKPLRIVFRDAGFKDDTAKTNVKQLLKQLSPETEMKVI